MNLRKHAVVVLALYIWLARGPVLFAAEPRSSHRSLGLTDNYDESQLPARLRAAEDVSLLRSFAQKRSAFLT